MSHDSQSDHIIPLEKTLDPLKRRFNDESGKIRFVALLSPTCPL